MQGKGHAELVLLVFVDDQAALEEVGFVTELGQTLSAVLVEFDAQHVRRVLLAQIDPGISLIHQPLQQGEEVPPVGLYRPGDRLLQLGLSGKGAGEPILGLDPFLGHALLLGSSPAISIGAGLPDRPFVDSWQYQAGIRPLRTSARRMFLHILPKL
ncbi:hypothetical protein D3C72_1868390 [compost metagenome]